MKELNKIDHGQDLVDSSCKSKVLKQLSIQLDLEVESSALMLDHSITQEQKQSLIFF